MLYTVNLWTFLIRRGICQYVAGILANLVVVVCALHFGWTSPYLAVLQSGSYTFQITSEEASYVVVMPLFGQIIGALSNAMIVDIIGRKKTIILSAALHIPAWLLIGLASSALTLFIGRFVAGFIDGLVFNVVPMYLGEIAAPKTRGLLGSLCPLSVVFGVLVMYVFGIFLPLHTTSLIQIWLPVFILLTFPWMPESPYFYLMKGRDKEAGKSLQMLRGTADVSEELNRISSAVKKQNENRGRWKELFTVKSNRSAVLICMGLRCFQQLSGSSTITYYSKIIFEEENGFISSSTAIIIYAIVQLVLTAFATVLVDIAGRRPLLLISLTGTALSLLSNGLFIYLKNIEDTDMKQFSFIPLLSLLSFTLMYSVGMQTVPAMMMGELFPTNIKAFALCYIEISFTAVLIIVSKFFHWSSETFGMHVPFFTFAFFTAIGIFFAFFVVPETKGKTLEDIQVELGSNEKKTISMVCSNCGLG